MGAGQGRDKEKKEEIVFPRHRADIGTPISQIQRTPSLKGTNVTQMWLRILDAKACIRRLSRPGDASIVTFWAWGYGRPGLAMIDTQIEIKNEFP